MGSLWYILRWGSSFQIFFKKQSFIISLSGTSTSTQIRFGTHLTHLHLGKGGKILKKTSHSIPFMQLKRKKWIFFDSILKPFSLERIPKVNSQKQSVWKDVFEITFSSSFFYLFAHEWIGLHQPNQLENQIKISDFIFLLYLASCSEVLYKFKHPPWITPSILEIVFKLCDAHFEKTIWKSKGNELLHS